MNQSPKVSICCLTHNHERYIATALDSFLAQQTDFDYEIVIGEDCSTDNTRAILNEYQRAHTGKIKLVKQEHNLMMVENFIATTKACTGKYIAFCEGDDYWTDPYKLAKQIKFLDDNPDYCLTYHNCYNHLPNGTLEHNHLLPGHDLSLSLESVNINWFVPSLSVVIRNTHDLYFPAWLNQVTLCDLPFLLLYARAGKMKYFSEVMANYRIHNTGSWSARSELARIDAIIVVLDKLAAEDFSQNAKRYIESIRKISLAKGFGYLLFKGTTDEFASFVGDERYGYTRYRKQPRALLRIRYYKTFLKGAGSIQRVRRVLKRMIR